MGPGARARESDVRKLFATGPLLVLYACTTGTQGSVTGPLCSGESVTLTFNDRTDRQEGISAGCRRTHPDGTVDEVWIQTGPKTTSTVMELDRAQLEAIVGASVAAARTTP
jgi:hypothetical protein